MEKKPERERSDKTRFSVSHTGPTNGLETFCLTCFMLENKLNEYFVDLIWKKIFYILFHNILEPGLHNNGAWAAIY